MGAKVNLHRLKAVDWIFLLAVLMAIVATARQAYGQKPAGRTVNIQSTSGEWLYPLDVDRTIEDIGSEGTCVIAIEDSSVFVRESDCPENICVRMGRIARQNEWIACVPHQIFITVKGEVTKQMDDISY
jgi:hypothetical protein